MKIKLKDGKELDVCFWSFAWKVLLTQIVINIILLIIGFILFAVIESFIGLG